MSALKDPNFLRQLTLTVVDKLAIAFILLAAGFFIQYALKNHEANNEKFLTNYKNELNKEADKLNKQYQMLRDSVQRIHSANQLENEQEFEQSQLFFRQQFQIERDLIQQRYSEEREHDKAEREGLLKREERFFEEQKLILENQQEVQLEVIKSNNDLTKKWVGLSVDFIGQAWKLINQVNLYSKKLEKKAKRKFKVPKEDIISSINQFKVLKSEKQFKYDNLKNKEIKIPILPGKRRRRAQNENRRKNSKLRGYEAQIAAISDSLKLINLDLELIEAKEVSELIRLLEIEKQKILIDAAREFISQNSFHIGINHQGEMIRFLDAQERFIEELPKVKSVDDVEELVKELDNKRTDIYQIRDRLLFGDQNIHSRLDTISKSSN